MPRLTQIVVNIIDTTSKHEDRAYVVRPDQPTWKLAVCEHVRVQGRSRNHPMMFYYTDNHTNGRRNGVLTTRRLPGPRASPGADGFVCPPAAGVTTHSAYNVIASDETFAELYDRARVVGATTRGPTIEIRRVETSPAFCVFQNKLIRRQLRILAR